MCIGVQILWKCGLICRGHLPCGNPGIQGLPCPHRLMPEHLDDKDDRLNHPTLAGGFKTWFNPDLGWCCSSDCCNTDPAGRLATLRHDQSLSGDTSVVKDGQAHKGRAEVRVAANKATYSKRCLAHLKEAACFERFMQGLGMSRLMFTDQRRTIKAAAKPMIDLHAVLDKWKLMLDTSSSDSFTVINQVSERTDEHGSFHEFDRASLDPYSEILKYQGRDEWVRKAAARTRLVMKGAGKGQSGTAQELAP